jgi:hypothetical protein
MATAFFGGSAAPPHHRSEKTLSCRMKKSAGSVASSLPQDCPMQLMFGAARFWRRGLSASRGFGFRIKPRGDYFLRHYACGTSV